MELRHLRYFVKSAELLHFTKAADMLHVSQPTLSVQIQQLESELGTTLFERTGRHVRLTNTGEVFLRYARQALDEIEAGQQRLQDLTGLLCGELRIGLTYSYSSEVMPRILAKFMQLHPGVRIHTTVSTNKGVREAVTTGELDLGVVCVPSDIGFRGSEPFTDANSRTLFEQEVVAVVSRKHCLARSRSLHLRQLAEYALALPSPKFNSRQVVDAVFASEKIEPRILIESEDISLLLGLAKLGVAATLVPSQATTDFSSKEIARIRLLDSRLRLTAAFIWPPGHEIMPAAKRLVELAAPFCTPSNRSSESG